jgi:hypothetical protein
MRRAAPVVLIVFLFLPGCGNGYGRVERAEAIVELDPHDSSILVRPFSAKEIRDEWVPGFRLLMRRSFPERTRIERWTVVSADNDGVEIEYATIADDGSVEGEPSVSRSKWTELRDHAAFPVENSTREWVSRKTALGDFEGWLYRVVEPGAAVVNEFFFVPELPGAPVQMQTLEGDTIVFELEQTARLRPDAN